MPKYTDIIRREPKIHLESLRDDLKSRKNKDFFWPCGTQVYCGRQGSGKTISAVKHALDLKQIYPKMIIVSNIQLKYYDSLEFDTIEDIKNILSYIDSNTQYILFKSMEQLTIALTQVNNSFYGVTYLIDEIHTYFNALESKNIPMYVFTEISQQRKQRKLIIGTSQLFLRMAKPFREQCDSLIICNTTFGVFTSQKAYDGMTLEQDFDGSLSGTIKKKGFFFHKRFIRNSFDTYQKVISGAEQYAQLERPTQIAKR